MGPNSKEEGVDYSEYYARQREDLVEHSKLLVKHGLCRDCAGAISLGYTSDKRYKYFTDLAKKYIKEGCPHSTPS